ncbi:UNVERIFIED_CONTAM: hypothetical protein PYX00_005199 [Menopon gallinae]|uniref:Uncharacterized protein n=1 Tax=Menopon gallinae TaxID=328185 RepID=A0AAW2HQA6_9NEOP
MPAGAERKPKRSDTKGSIFVIVKPVMPPYRSIPTSHKNSENSQQTTWTVFDRPNLPYNQICLRYFKQTEAAQKFW